MRVLKVEAEGKLYSVPDKVEIYCPPSSTPFDLWWKVRFGQIRSEQIRPLFDDLDLSRQLYPRSV